MRILNLQAADQLHGLASADGTSGVHAVTDVTGFGLAGHGWEMAERSGVTVRLVANDVPLYPGALAASAAGVRTGGDGRNRAYLAGRFANEASTALEGLALDPQTSGGLLAAVSPELAPTLVTQGWWPIGDVAAGLPSVVLTDHAFS
jgi:selenide,water dikinase